MMESPRIVLVVGSKDFSIPQSLANVRMELMRPTQLTVKNVSTLAKHVRIVPSV